MFDGFLTKEVPKIAQKSWEAFKNCLSLAIEIRVKVRWDHGWKLLFLLTLNGSFGENFIYGIKLFNAVWSVIRIMENFTC